MGHSNDTHKWTEKVETDNEGATTIGYVCTKCQARRRERPAAAGETRKNYREWQYQYSDHLPWTEQYFPCNHKHVSYNTDNSGVYLQQINARHKWDTIKRQWVNVYEMTLASPQGKAGTVRIEPDQFKQLAFILAEFLKSSQKDQQTDDEDESQ